MEDKELILKPSYFLIRRNLAILLLAASWPYFVMALCFIASALIYRQSHRPTGLSSLISLSYSMGGWEKLGIVSLYLVWTSLPHGLAIAGVVSVVWKDFQTGSVALQDAFSGIAKVFWRLLFLSVFTGLASQIAGLFYLVPAAFVQTFTSLAIPELVVEHRKVPAALSKSFALAASRFDPIFGLCSNVLVTMAFVAWGLYSLAIVSKPLPWWVGLATIWFCVVVFATLITMTRTTILMHIYRDIRTEREKPSLGTGALISTPGFCRDQP
jgi:hypothetical protein